MKVNKIKTRFRFFNQPYLLYVHQIVELQLKSHKIIAHIVQRRSNATSSGDIAIIQVPV
jgi:hypothetical protein